MEGRGKAVGRVCRVLEHPAHPEEATVCHMSGRAVSAAICCTAIKSAAPL